LNHKGLAQQAVAERVLLAREARDPALAALVDDWLSVRHRLAKLSVGDNLPRSAPAEQQQLMVDTARREQELARQLGQVKIHEVDRQPWYELEQLRNQLPASSVYIDVVRYAPGDKPDEATYLAWVVPPAGSASVRLIDLGSADEIDDAVSRFRSALHPDVKALDPDSRRHDPSQDEFDRASERLSQCLIAPLLPAIGDFEHWIVCPDGTPWLVPISALALPREPGGSRPFVVERHRVSFVVSGRDLIRQSASVSGNPSLIMAAADFDHVPDDSRVEDLIANRPRFDDNDENRGAAAVPENWPPLPGTADEAQFVAPALTAYTGHESQILLGLKASEGALKDAWRPRIALVSTHGFFLASPRASERVSQSNPLLRCGLVLAGANQPALRRDALSDDGVVTGLDVLSVDLQGTELVVLSACETGLGQLQAGEGVAGLRQAFQLAGARSVIATLWRIPDQETAQLMSLFFDQLAAGSDKAMALAQAQRQFIAARRGEDKPVHPYFWAAFTLTGDWRTAKVGPTEPRPPRPTARKLIEIVVETARVMDGGTIVAQLSRGERLVRGETKDGWIQVFYAPGSTRSGWVRETEVRQLH
jgi:CHAT domain-containing protein